MFAHRCAATVKWLSHMEPAASCFCRDLSSAGWHTTSSHRTLPRVWLVPHQLCIKGFSRQYLNRCVTFSLSCWSADKRGVGHSKCSGRDNAATSQTGSEKWKRRLCSQPTWWLPERTDATGIKIITFSLRGSATSDHPSRFSSKVAVCLPHEPVVWAAVCCSLQMKMTMEAGQHRPEGRMRHHYGAECHWVTFHICSISLEQTHFGAQTFRSVVALRTKRWNCVGYIQSSSHLNVEMLMIIQILKCFTCGNAGLQI